MGNCGGKKEELNEVDKFLEEQKEHEALCPKILLLGAGESGKSTVIKQIKLIWMPKEGMSENDKIDFRVALRRNTIEVAQVLIEAGKTLNVPITNEETIKAAAAVMEVQSDADLTPELAAHISTVWQDEAIKIVYGRRSEYWNLDATPYYLNEALRYSDPNFDPSEEDVIMARIRTTGIVVTEVPDPPYKYSVVDVGGQRSERRKWIHCFDNVSAIIFLEGLSGYNQVLFEDNSVNRMKESLELFESIIKNSAFKNTPIFVFLNKKDLFEEMIPKFPLTNCFPEYTGEPCSMQPALEYIIKQYNDIVEKNCPGREIYIHVIAARLRMDMKIAFGEVKDTLKKLQKAKTKK